jgi:hypothetical protein
MTEKEFKYMQKIEAEVDKGWDDLSNWEQKFIEDILERYKQYGRGTLISPKQADHIERIWEKIV